MIVSMTGFGRAKKGIGNVTVQAELKSVNHRFCEINIRMPRQLFILEDKMKKAIMKHVQRGRVEVFITIEGEGLVQKSLTIDWALLDSLVTSMNQVKETYQLSSKEISPHELLSYDHILSVEEKEIENKDLELLVLEVIQTAAIELKKMRVREGEKLLEDITNFLNQIEMNVHSVIEYAPQVTSQYRNRILKRVKEYVGNEFDDNRLLTEVAVFAEKADISEELTRLQSHISQFRETVVTSGPVGRKLDFIVQEMNREINTIGSKANDSMLAKHVVEMKSLLEKIKEQVQNIE
ncbi:YicC/YloC family endoribonuclease [Fredinandcohnia sp. 179-A 10B2 NHS]|uniref:YicC/YloC family endoribonuclease n=1 Tax=Fredinandcohnia sp. 179-A 10B2 NHS TaxID=3235176 RepID=UPI0039A327A6